MARPKLKIGDKVVVRNLYEAPFHKHGEFNLGDQGIVTKITGDVIHLEVYGIPRKINIYNLKKWRKYIKKDK